ncbi:MAG TPA: hypothetical protein VFV81_06975 [Verrucomicrobiae bacterium]|nr:hypothetical protein [Verrucomicrobiae bacterium]
MKTKMIAILSLAAAPVLVGCASPVVTLDTVGPAPVKATAATAMGHLQVYSATETHQLAQDLYYYPHTGYRIYSASGKLVEYVPNHAAVEDETPSWVSLPAGHYLVKAQSDYYPTVMVPVDIQEGRTTEVHLNLDWKPANGANRQVVRLPDGKAVGYREPAD